jgi:two-component system cell cycle response regulator
VLAGETLGQMFRIERPETVIGCAAEADIRVLDDGVSRRHARIVLDDEEVCIEDLESVTGTLLNGDRVRRVVLRDGDQIQIGSTTVLQFTHADEPAADAHPRMHRAIWQVGPTRAWLCLQKGR